MELFLSLFFLPAIAIVIIFLCLCFLFKPLFWKNLFNNLPIIEAKAVLLEKTQNNHQYGSSFYLTFALEDDSKITFKVMINQYAEISKNEKGLLKYKHLDKKSGQNSNNQLLNYQFVGFEKEK